MLDINISQGQTRLDNTHDQTASQLNALLWCLSNERSLGNSQVYHIQKIKIYLYFCYFVICEAEDFLFVVSHISGPSCLRYIDTVLKNRKSNKNLFKISEFIQRLVLSKMNQKI